MKVFTLGLLALGFIATHARAADVSLSTGLAGPLVSMIGSGCPKDGSGSNSHFEGSVLVVNFANMVAEKGEGISLINSRKTCSITIDLKIPNGLSYSLLGYSAQGSDTLADTDTRSLNVTNFFQGQSQTTTLSSEAKGPVAASFSPHHWNNVAESLWSPCGVQRAQTVTIALRVSGTDRSKDSSSTLDSIRLPMKLRLCAGGLRD